MVHRGAGKTIIAVNELVKAAATCEDNSGAQFLYVAPTKVQAKRVAWKKLKYYSQHIPDIHIREDELTITFSHNNATIYIAGADEDGLRGLHPHYLVLDEVGQMSKDFWVETAYPGTVANNARVLFIGTPKGDNLFKEIYDQGKQQQEDGDPSWFTCLIDVYRSKVRTLAQIEEARKMMPQAKFEQEMLCSFESTFTGAFFGDLLNERNIGDYHYDPMLPVITGWDFGTADLTVIWFAQLVGDKIHLIDYYEDTNKPFHHYINYVKNKPYHYSYHVIPHDGANRNWETNKNRSQILKGMGLRTVLAPRLKFEEGISITQNYIYKCRFDKVSTKQGLSRLYSYQSRLDPLTGEPTGIPKRGPSEDTADALRTLITGLKLNKNLPQDSGTGLFRKEPIRSYGSFNVFGY